MTTMLTDREIEARFRRESLVFFGVLLAMLLIVSLGTTLIIATPAWQSRLDTLVTSGGSKTAIALHMAIAALPALFCLILLPRLLRRDELRCGHCARRLGSVAISTGNCGGCGRPAVVRTGACEGGPRCAGLFRCAGLWPARCADLLRCAGLWPARRYAGVRTDVRDGGPRTDERARGPRTNGRAGGPRTGETPIEGAGPTLTAAELNAAVRRALPLAFAGIAALFIVLVLGAVFVGSNTPASTRLLILMPGIALMVSGIVIADRRVPRCPSCRKSLVPTWFPVTTGRCWRCGVRVMESPALESAGT